MRRSKDEEEVTQLEHLIRKLRIEGEEIDRKRQEVRTDIQYLEQKLEQAKRSKTRRNSNCTPKRATSTIVKGPDDESEKSPVGDRNGDPLYIGAEVYICTSGAYPSRQGVLKSLAQAPKLCEILDTDGNIQSRLAKNIVLESASTRKYLK